jgi:predicted O-methyltransferase YrrM
MDYSEFYHLFGASYRTKNLSWTCRPLLSAIRKFFKARKRKNQRSWVLPTNVNLPREFIRLCPWEGEYLFNLAKRAKRGILETGRFHGGSCFLMSCSNGAIPIYSIDIDPKDDDLLRGFFRTYGVGENVELIVGDSQKTKYNQIEGYDILWIDGDHSYEGCTNDLENWYDGLEVGGHILLHDCYEGNEVKDSILDFMRKHPEVRAVNTPYRSKFYWHYPEGSIFHMIKGNQS